MAEVESIHSPASPQSPQSETIHSREPSSDLPLDDSQTKAMNGSSHEQTASSNTLVDPIDSGVDASVEGANAQDVFSSDPTKAPAKPKAAISGDAKIRKSMAPSSGKPTAKVSTGAAGATSPNVKKIISSGTFGPSVTSKAPVKPVSSPTTATAPKPATTTTVSTTASSATRRTTSTASAAPSKPATPVTGSNPPTTTARTSATTTAPKPTTTATTTATTRPSVAASAAARRTSAVPPTSSATATGTARARASMAPTTTAARTTAPRASTATTSSAATARHVTKPSVSRTVTSTAPKDAAKEAPSNNKANEELEQKLQESVADVASKAEHIATIDAELTALKTRLESKLSESGERTGELEALQKVVSESHAIREKVEQELQELKSATDLLREEKEAQAVKSTEELQLSQKNLKEAEELVEKLSHDLTTVQTALAIANDTVKARDDNDQQSATVEHDALVKAKADLEAIRIETELLTAAHNVALQQSTTRIAELEAHAASLETATQELNENLQKLKKEKDDALAKLSELEVEVLELKEQVETNEHDGARQVSDMKAMHTAEIQSIREDLESKLGKAVEANTEAAAKWEEATKAAQENHSATLESAVKEAEDTADRASQEALKALIDGHVASLSEKDATFKQLLEEAEKKYEEKTEGLTAQVKALTVELEGQEAHYNVKLTGAQNEHATLLQKAFSDAKAEAGSVHAQDLSALRTQSQATIEQVRTAHKNEIESIKAAHDASFATEVDSLGKKLSNLILELGATREDLAKAKAATITSQKEASSLKDRLEDAKLQAVRASSATVDTGAAEIERLTKELAATSDDLDSLKKVFQESQTNSVNHIERELAQAAQGKVQAIEALKLAHETDLAKLNGEKAQLRSDIEDIRDERDKALSDLSKLSTTATPTKAATPVGASGLVPKEELEKAYLAHDLKNKELREEHAKALEKSKEEMNQARAARDDLEAALHLREMEIGFVEQEKNDMQDLVDKLEEEVAALKAQLHG